MNLPGILIHGARQDHLKNTKLHYRGPEVHTFTFATAFISKD